MKKGIISILMIILSISFSAYAQDKTNVTDTMEKRILVAFSQEQAKTTM